MRIRFVPKSVDNGWRVYDTFQGSFPYQRHDVGVVAQDVPTEDEAQREAERLNGLGLNTEKHWAATRGTHGKRHEEE